MNSEAAIRGFFLEQARACGQLGSPFMARLLTLVARRLQARGTVGRRVLSWPGPAGGADDALALRLAAGLHALALSGADPALARAYPPHAVDDERLWQAVEAALADHAPAILAWLDQPPQTNEVGRSAPLIAAAHWLTAHFGLPLVLSELGASAGLNLLFDQYALRLGGQVWGPQGAEVALAPAWRGPPPPRAAPVLADRAGADIAPFDPLSGRLRLLSYIWADQTQRVERAMAALDLAARLRPPVYAADAGDFAQARLARPLPGHLHVVFHTIAWQYFPAPTRQRILAALDAAGAAASLDAPLAHLFLEPDDGTRGARLALRLWPGGATLELGRADFHGRWVDWQDPLA